MNMASPSGILTTRDFTDPIVPTTEQAKHRTHRQNIMEVGDDKIGIVQNLIDAGDCQHHARHTPDGEQKDEADRPEHWHSKAD